ncbi:MAG TPA: DinB family protein [Ignavibacteria bacterium]|nr:DinB family protein [Ignavibacteria bacterium]HMQ98841.1 DinB family protein [Ignavibacteria bacterium]
MQINVLSNSINRISSLLNEVPEKVMSIAPAEIVFKKSPEKWSKKEILGHLCDSAVNNLGRFVRAQFEEQPFKIIPYAQDDWVRINHYNVMETGELLNYWVSLNRQIVQIISNIPEEKLAVTIELANAAFREDTSEKNLLWLIEDYVVHMEYHLKQVV